MIPAPLLLAFVCIFVMVAMTRMKQSREMYVCPQCHSRNGEHHESCSFRKLDE